MGEKWGHRGIGYLPYTYLCDTNYVYDPWVISDRQPIHLSLDDVKSAVYGKIPTVIDVTTVLKDYVIEGHAEVPASNRLFGDPCYNIAKELKITLNNERVYVVPENQRISISNLISTARIIRPAKVIKARYGCGKKWLDVTNRVRTLMIQGARQIPVTNELFTDPCPGVKSDTNYSGSTRESQLSPIPRTLSALKYSSKTR